LLTKEREKKIKIKNEKMAARSNFRRDKWVRANSQNEAIAESKFRTKAKERNDL